MFRSILPERGPLCCVLALLAAAGCEADAGGADVPSHPPASNSESDADDGADDGEEPDEPAAPVVCADAAIDSQAGLEALADCNEIHDLSIQGAVTSLAPLARLERVTGHLDILDAQITDLSGLSA